MNAAREGQGGLIALSVEECDELLSWLSVCHSEFDGVSDFTEADALGDRLEEWRSRHVPAGAVDGD